MLKWEEKIVKEDGKRILNGIGKLLDNEGMEIKGDDDGGDDVGDGVLKDSGEMIKNIEMIMKGMDERRSDVSKGGEDLRGKSLNGMIM